MFQQKVTKAFTLTGAAVELGRAEVVKVTGRPFDRALRLTTTTTPGVEWNLYLTAPTAAPVKKGDVVLARFWLRCHESMTGEGFTTFAFEAPGHEPLRIAEFRAGAGPEWREFNVPFRATTAFAR